MTRSDFIEGLRTALESHVSAAKVRENMDFYNQYISEEIKSGKTEKEVLEELGDPWVLAQTIIDRAYPAGYGTFLEDEEVPGEEEEHIGTRGVTLLWKRIGIILGFIGILLLVAVIFSGIVSFLLFIALPVFIAITVFRVFARK